MTPTWPDDESRFRALMDEHHYLGAPSKIGQTIWYAADDGSGEWLALAAFSAAALKCGVRDAWIGWNRCEQLGRLYLIANNMRLLLRGRRPNLGSRFLALCAQRISTDGQARYHHPLLLETFVDPARFPGTVCRRRGEGYVVESMPKRVLLLPLESDVRDLLRAPALASRHQLHGVEKMTTAEAAGILACFKDAVDRPRSAGGHHHRIESLLALCAAAVLCGTTGWKALHEWIQSLNPAMPPLTGRPPARAAVPRLQAKRTVLTPLFHTVTDTRQEISASTVRFRTGGAMNSPPESPNQSRRLSGSAKQALSRYFEKN